MGQERKYLVKESWIFNLESMHDRIWCIIYDVRDKVITLPVEVAGRIMKDEDDLQNLLEECYELEWIAKSRRVTGKEYGRIKEIVNYRVMARYARCMASGMRESDAGACFEDL